MSGNIPTREIAALIKTIGVRTHPLAPKPTGVRPTVRYLVDIKAVLFDVYGTLLISGAGDIGANMKKSKPRDFQAAVEAVGLPRIDAPTAAFYLSTLEEKIRVILRGRQQGGMASPEIDIEQIWRDMLRSWRRNKRWRGTLGRDLVRRLVIEYEFRVNPVWPMPGLACLWPRLKAAGLRLGIVSNAQFYTPIALAAFPEVGWTQGVFDKTLCAWSYLWKEAKPSDRMLKAILVRLSKYHDIMPSQTLVIGNDMLKDILPANRLGCQTALFAGDARSLRWRAEQPECRTIEPTLILTKMPQLLKVLERSR